MTQRMKRLVSIFSAAIMLLAITASAAVAGPGDFEIPIDTIITAPAGSYIELASEETPPEIIGATCLGLAAAENQQSVHPGNDIIISTGDTEAVLVDVEGAPGKVTQADGPITLGPTVVLTLHMGDDEVFSGGLVVIIDVNCTLPPTTTVPPTTVPPTTVPPVVEPPAPAIEIIKTADVEFYVDLTGEFTIDVTNPGPVALHDVHVTDQYAIDIDPGSDCPQTIGDLAVDETFTYSCTIANLDGASIYDNWAVAIGTGPLGTEVTDTDNALVYPILGETLTTAPPVTTEAPSETLPVTGISGDQAESFGAFGLMLVMGGIVMLSGAALVGQRRTDR
jgi:hypothetical protein